MKKGNAYTRIKTRLSKTNKKMDTEPTLEWNNVHSKPVLTGLASPKRHAVVELSGDEVWS